MYPHRFSLESGFTILEEHQPESYISSVCLNRQQFNTALALSISIEEMYLCYEKTIEKVTVMYSTDLTGGRLE